MKVKKIEMSWISVTDAAKSQKFFIEALGLRFMSGAPEYGWVELSGHEEGGAHLGLGTYKPQGGECAAVKPGQNAVVCFNVDNIDEAKSFLMSKKVRIIGDIVEVPGHVKMLTVADEDNNIFQFVQKLS